MNAATYPSNQMNDVQKTTYAPQHAKEVIGREALESGGSTVTVRGVVHGEESGLKVVKSAT